MTDRSSASVPDATLRSSGRIRDAPVLVPSQSWQPERLRSSRCLTVSGPVVRLAYVLICISGQKIQIDALPNPGRRTPGFRYPSIQATEERRRTQLINRKENRHCFRGATAYRAPSNTDERASSEQRERTGVVPVPVCLLPRQHGQQRYQSEEQTCLTKTQPRTVRGNRLLRQT